MFHSAACIDMTHGTKILYNDYVNYIYIYIYTVYRVSPKKTITNICTQIYHT